ncbi:hypothetical protein FNT36_18330 [Hymenobacter setariae]|uniref:Uncharacterized protein n=1 Tax=Hymenobacter setariae TaxID=2594794 RepID=A0A558BSV0_9BACT|nr:hypothetical protein [Hymenobacter setariae]TVT39600.1 hypothetical protein FNT36_18330 [Hymenobacter setariae]
MKKLLFLGACLVALASQPVMAQTGGSTEVDVTVVRVTASYPRTLVTITRPGGKEESLDFDNYGRGEKRPLIGPGLQQVVADLYKQGYQLQSTFDTTLGTSSSASVLLFIRKKQ